MPQTSELSKEYDELFERADTLFNKYNPCNNQGNDCTRGLNSACCTSCSKLKIPEGCQIKSLTCRLWICNSLEESLVEYGQHDAFLTELRELQRKASKFYVSRGSKERSLIKARSL